MIAYLDRNNLATAALQMPHDLGFDDRVIGFGAGIFALGYVILEIPGTLIVERWSARRSITRIIIADEPATSMVAMDVEMKICSQLRPS